MEALWAPWRIEYILGPKETDCIFCTKPAAADDKKNLILHRGACCFVIMNYYPYNNGHVMVVPYKHTANLQDLSDDENKELMNLMTLSCKVLQQNISPHGFNIGMNLGTVAGAGVKDHLHFHVVPRWNGDTNFMPITGHTKVLSEGLEQTWEKLKAGFEQAQ
jgi:ATP adenylyltransferase